MLRVISLFPFAISHLNGVLMPLYYFMCYLLHLLYHLLMKENKSQNTKNSYVVHMKNNNLRSGPI